MSTLRGKPIAYEEIEPYDLVNLKEANRRYNEVTKGRFMYRNNMSANSILITTILFAIMWFIMFLIIYNHHNKFLISYTLTFIGFLILYVDKYKIRMLTSLIQIRHYNIKIVKSTKSVDFFLIMKVRDKKTNRVRISILPKEQALKLREEKIGKEYYFYFGSNESIHEMIFDYIEGGKLSLSEIAYDLTLREEKRIFRRAK